MLPGAAQPEEVPQKLYRIPNWIWRWVPKLLTVASVLVLTPKLPGEAMLDPGRLNCGVLKMLKNSARN